MAKKNLKMSIVYMEGHFGESVAEIPLSRPLLMVEVKSLWDVERVLNSLPLRGGCRIKIDLEISR